MGRRALLSILGATAFLGAPAAASGAPDWLQHRTLNIAHQGGEDEAPSNTMYAYWRSMFLGSDMLEVDIHTTADGHVVSLHDGEVDRTTEGTGSVYDMTLAEVQALDAAHDFVPGVGTDADAPAGDHPFRGVRTGARRPPTGFLPDDFRIPTLEEVMRAYPDVPINIEIKGESDTNEASFLRNAEALAALLGRLGRTEGIIVASFNDTAVERFHQLMPEIDLAPATGETAAFKLGGVPPSEGRVAFQVPITFGGVQVTDEEFVADAHAIGLAVHVWLSNDPENDDVYRQLLGWNVDGIMAAEPTALEQRLCENGVPRPGRPTSFPGRHCNHDRVSIACDVAPTGLSRMSGSGRVRIELERLDGFEGRCAGTLRLRAGGRGVRGLFDFGSIPPAAGGPLTQTVEVRVRKGMRGRIERRARRAKVRSVAYHAFGSRETFRLRPAAK